MDGREALLILHLVSAFLLVGGAGATTALGIRAGTTTSTRVIAAVTGLSHRIENFVISPGALGVVVFGTWLAIYLDRDFGEAWLGVSYVLWLIAVLVGPLVLGRHARAVNERAEALVAEGVEDSEELRLMADEPRIKLIGVGLNLFFVVFLYLMIVQPGS